MRDKMDIRDIRNSDQNNATFCVFNRLRMSSVSALAVLVGCRIMLRPGGRTPCIGIRGHTILFLDHLPQWRGGRCCCHRHFFSVKVFPPLHNNQEGSYDARMALPFAFLPSRVGYSDTTLSPNIRTFYTWKLNKNWWLYFGAERCTYIACEVWYRHVA